MNSESRDDLDRAIDDVLASMVAGEPRLVDAASVRKAMGERRAFRVPVWLAAAAILLLAIGVAILTRTPAGKSPAIAHSGTSPIERAPRTRPSLDTSSMAAATAAPVPAPARRGDRKKASEESPFEPAYEGLPRLVVASIDLPEPISTEGLGADPLRIARIEIAPLLVTSLPPDHEPNP